MVESSFVFSSATETIIKKTAMITARTVVAKVESIWLIPILPKMATRDANNAEPMAKRIQRGIGEVKNEVTPAQVVPREGLEPSCLAARDFESRAYTNSATAAPIMRDVLLCICAGNLAIALRIVKGCLSRYTCRVMEARIIPISNIETNPWQPRKTFTTEELADLASSIKRYGVLQPLVVSELGSDRYRLIAGERRLRASKLAGLTTVPVTVRAATDEEQLELALIENIQRQDLNAIERARAYQQLMDKFHLTQEEAARRLGKSRPAVANALRLLNLPQVIQDAVSSGKLTEGHARVIAGLPTEALQLKFFERVSSGEVSVRDTEKAGKAIKQQAQGKKPAESADGVEHYKELLEGRFGTKVAISAKQGSGDLTIHFYSEEELVEIVKKMLGEEGN